ncbi:AbrB/MazE/SpoVT family DNA-binding domain-containing protein [Halobacillus trueperi]|uniref:AbrB/MazE/SpoVT family DNA-binding domain-containing protein n=1 Tax=Halobacillus trueperi TaxID=156205 RepID=A0A3D8VN83_9BACI|nr:AbrB/MazE/SpoVT family DNA-binding domain-containing protein [Halobacillus trueperi]RDY70288.1 AbrB/MazE/SpoVT family DNA-binding domain-containing protein [Halobacillus trueperi]
MKATGITRKVDELGRVVIPIELRRTLGINEKDTLEIFVNEDSVVLKKYKPSEDKEKVLQNLGRMKKHALHEDQIQAIEEVVAYVQQ